MLKETIKNWVPDPLFLKMKYRRVMGASLHLRNPQTFNEKLQWLKIHDRNPLYTTLVDKYEVKHYVADKIGEEYIIPTLGLWDSFDEIDFDSLPNQFVLKCTHDSGGVVICPDKSKWDMKAAEEKINRCMKRNYYWVGREWPYKNVKPRIIAERYMADESGVELKDYKFMCFDGEPRIVLVCTDRFSEAGLHEDFFDMNWTHLPMKRPEIPNSEHIIDRPKSLNAMVNMTKTLAKDIPFVRVDFYEVCGKIYFGEFTFYPQSGFTGFNPEKWDYNLGQLFNLSI